MANFRRVKYLDKIDFIFDGSSSATLRNSWPSCVEKSRRFCSICGIKLAGSWGERHKLAQDSWSCEFVTLENSVTMTIITFPEPGAMTEPFFVAAVFRPAEPGSELQAVARWFALEYTTGLPEMDAKAFFCEWTSDGKHQNMDQHTEITHEAFVAAVRAMLEPEPDL